MQLELRMQLGALAETTHLQFNAPGCLLGNSGFDRLSLRSSS